MSSPSESDLASTVSAPRVASGPVPYRMPDLEADLAFARNMGIAFRDIRTLRLALTHRSVLHDWLNIEHVDAILQSNERLEFLGDALLGMLVGEFLYRTDPAADEGTLTRHRAAIVRAETLVRWARGLELQEYLYLGTGESVTHSARDRMLAGGFEALVGAIYLDRGGDVVERFIRGYLERDMRAILATEEDTNPKGTLQEVMQERYGEPPEYETIAAEGPDHARQFTVAVILKEERIGVGKGRSKREAQQAAARKALATLGVVAEQPALSSASALDSAMPDDIPGDAGADEPGSPASVGMVAPIPRRIVRPRPRLHVRGSGKREG